MHILISIYLKSFHELSSVNIHHIKEAVWSFCYEYMKER